MGDSPVSIMPTCGWTTDALLIRVKDGDTDRFFIWRELDGRLINCWAPETRKTDIEGEKEKGLEAKRYVTRLLEQESPAITMAVSGHPVRIFIPASQRGLLTDVTTMGRFKMHVYLPSGLRLDAEIIDAGHAERTKEELLEILRREQTS